MIPINVLDQSAIAIRRTGNLVPYKRWAVNGPTVVPVQHRQRSRLHPCYKQASKSPFPYICCLNDTAMSFHYSKWSLSEVSRLMSYVGTYQHMSACPHVLTHVSMQDKVQMVGIKGAEIGFTCWNMTAHVGTYQHKSVCPHMCWHMPLCRKGSNYWYQRCREGCYMLAHISTCRHVHRCWHMPAST